jgi:hypothetical protein
VIVIAATVVVAVRVVAIWRKWNAPVAKGPDLD